MNAIKELAIEAGFPSIGFSKDGPAIMNEREVYRFAQLIVKECIDLADIAEPYKAGDLIREHFAQWDRND